MHRHVAALVGAGVTIATGARADAQPVGLEVAAGGATPAPHAILSDYGTTEYSPDAFWATTVGLTF